MIARLERIKTLHCKHVAVLTLQDVHWRRRGQGGCFIVSKRPAAMLMREDGVTRIFDPIGRAMELQVFDEAFPGERGL
jgi:hypothetical protein